MARRTGYVHAVEVKEVEGTLYCAGQAAVLPEGASSNTDYSLLIIYGYYPDRSYKSS